MTMAKKTSFTLFFTGIVLILFCSIGVFFFFSKNNWPVLIPYLLLVCALISLYTICVRLLHAKEQSIQIHQATLKNTHAMIRGQIHDISNFIGTAYGWCQSTFRTSDPEKRNVYWQKATLSFNSVSEHLRTISTILSGSHAMVRISPIPPHKFVNRLFSFLVNACSLEIKLERTKTPQFVPGRITIVVPARFSCRSLEMDVRACNNAIMGLVANAQKAGATSMIILLSEKNEKSELDIHIKDNGSGVPAEIRGLLFREKINNGNGEGIGLLCVRMIMESLGAKIRLANPPAVSEEKCTEFIISGLKARD